MKNTTTSLPTSSKKTKKKQALKTPEIQSISNYNNKNQFYPISKNNIPKLRFNKFENNWNVYIFKDILDIISGYGFKMNEYSSNGVPLIKINNIGYGNILIDDMDYLPEDYLEKYPNLVLNKNDILLALNRPITNNKLKIALLKNEDVPSILYQRVGKIILKNDNLYYLFIYYLLQEKIFKFILKNSKGSDQPFISTNELKKIELKIPSLKEQKKIGNFLSIMDKKLFLMEKKHSLYVDIKKYLLKNLFVHEDEKSFLRFKRYDDILQRVSLSEILEESKIKSKDDINKRISVKLNLKGVVKRIPNTNEIEGATTQYLRKKGQFIYGKQNLYKGAFGIVPSNLDGYLSSSDIPSFDFIKLIDEMWLFYYLSDKDYYTKLERLSTGTGSKRISPEDFLKIKINIPSIEEQKEISNMLKFFDHKIENIKKQIFLFSKFKKGLLQRMFC
ncbi:restriction endonuclease subunit S [Methanosphaera cuniculi]|uniref:Type I restriction modification DNA specificity domain-containing protein n=3 Tax=Methanosphaera cuniculi TaxID=1077256 RepID=A0A2A2HET6_9EURY|nr:restriction endonuclease subunit S [Methanosphaera cuniculi]PAV07981.1 hypothetical protein ASJ82_01705 [Methanosphaera cuniculi]